MIPRKSAMRTTEHRSRDEHRAQQVILHILHVAYEQKRELNKTQLFKAFYAAHLNYAKVSPRVLSNWPIVRMPNGPGIDDFDALMSGIGSKIMSRTEATGPYMATLYTLANRMEPTLDDIEMTAVNDATDWVLGRSAAELSELTHERSRSWQQGKDGDELDIYIDIESDQEYEARERRKREILKEVC